MMYLQLFLSFLQIGALSFGGGYAAMPLIEAQIVTTHGWLTMTEFANLVTIAEMTPDRLPSMRRRSSARKSRAFPVRWLQQPAAFCPRVSWSR